MSERVRIELDGGVYEGPRPPVSVVILTFNEEANIASCIQSCAWSDDVHVLDSGSKDRTVEIARSMGVTVHHNPFKSFGDQRNWAIDHIPCKHPWHFHLDADERFTPEVVREMVELLGPDGGGTQHACFLCPSKMIFMGRWLRHSANYPSYQVRLFRHGLCRFMDFGHGQREDAQGTIGTMIEPYMHYAFSKGLSEWLYKHNAYSDREAREGMAVRAHGRPSLASLVVADSTARRRAAKNLSYFLPLRAAWRFTYSYLLRAGFLDGLAGLHYCLMISMYEYWIELKIRELNEAWSRETDEHVGRMLARSAVKSGDDPARPPAGVPT
ncbi:MAG: glycosyltransferase family 2 protein, partial [Phycisphaerae bacterium]|nr:glycosyltransferase family 2 protein [Phycisphaerae bacterium]